MAKNKFLNQAELDQTQFTKIVDIHSHLFYLVSGCWGNLHDRLSIYSLDGDKIAEVHQIDSSLNPKFEIFYKNQMIGSSIINFNFHYASIFINGINWLIIGNFKSNKFQVINKFKTIGTIKTVTNSMGTVKEIHTQHIELEPILIIIAAILKHPTIESKLPKSLNEPM